MTLQWDDEDWEYFQENLRELVGKHTGYWYCEADGLGWQKRSGHKYFAEKDAGRLTQHILPGTQNSFEVFRGKPRKDGYHFKIINSHHDAMGEVYRLRKVSVTEFRENT